MNSIAKFQEMQPFAKQIAAKGYAVATLQNGWIEVQDPVRHADGSSGFMAVRLYCARDARKFINERN